jgi:hypothetical protein
LKNGMYVQYTGKYIQKRKTKSRKFVLEDYN